MFGKTEKMLEEFEEIVDEKLAKNLNYAFANSFNLYLEKFREMVDHENKLIQNSANEAIEKIRLASTQISNINELINSNRALAINVENLVEEIRKRDAIIERKNKQISKLKEQ